MTHACAVNDWVTLCGESPLPWDEAAWEGIEVITDDLDTLDEEERDALALFAAHNETTGRTGGATMKSEQCPNCGSERYTVSIALEVCSDCGIACDYHGGGVNAKWATWEKERARAEEEKRYWEERRARSEEW